MIHYYAEEPCEHGNVRMHNYEGNYPMTVEDRPTLEPLDRPELEEPRECGHDTADAAVDVDQGGVKGGAGRVVDGSWSASDQPRIFDAYLSGDVELHLHVVGHRSTKVDSDDVCAVYRYLGSDVDRHNREVGRVDLEADSDEVNESEVGRSVLVPIVEFREDGQFVELGSIPSVVRLRTANECFGVGMKAFNRLFAPLFERQGVNIDREGDPAGLTGVWGARMGDMEGVDHIVEGAAHLMQGFTEIEEPSQNGQVQEQVKMGLLRVGLGVNDGVFFLNASEIPLYGVSVFFCAVQPVPDDFESVATLIHDD